MTLSRNFYRYLLIAIVVLSIAGSAFAQSTLEIDANSFIASINTWLAMAISITAIGVGIAGAFALARYVGRMILDAFGGKM
jgi:hypothetical protein